MDNQQEIWDSIAQPWKTFKVKPIEEVEEFLKNKKGNILDLGCGTGRHFIKVKGKIYGVDLSDEMLKLAKKEVKENNLDVELVHAEADILPFNDDFFDSAIYMAVLHCIPESNKRKESLRELYRVMKSKSEAMVSVWDKNQEKFKNMKKDAIIPWKYEGKTYNRYYYLYERDEFITLLRKIGFEIVKVFDQENADGLHSKKNIIAIVRKP